MNQQVSQRISDLETALNDCPQARLSQLLKYAMVVCNLFIVGILLLLFYVVFFVPKPTPEQVVTFLKFAVIFLLFYPPVSYLQGLQQEAIKQWRFRVRISVNLLCTWGNVINEEQRDTLIDLLTKKKKDLELAFEGCDTANQQMLEHLSTLL